jgi:phosphoglycolate phosphatase-like HAD superfamily hydrolase
VFNHLLRDLDGTLVDSSNGILNTQRTCLASLGKHSKVDLTHQLIGPPLRTMIQAATGSSDVGSTTEIETAFRVEYDLRGYLATRAYPGIREALTEAQAHGVHLEFRRPRWPWSGDSVNDALAAIEKRIFFARATWGYGLEASLGECRQPIEDAQQMMQLGLRGHSALVAHGR